MTHKGEKEKNQSIKKHTEKAAMEKNTGDS